MLHNPAPGRPVTSPYGWRIHPISKVRKLHRGTDYGGTFDVLAAGDGVVSFISYNGNKRTGGGHVVKIDHGDCVTVYYHGREKTHLSLGQRVRAGDKVYTSGSTGASTGPHLHFEVRKPGGKWGTDMDPAPWFKAGSTQATTVVPSGLKVTGRLDRETVRAWQRYVKTRGWDVGRIDGVMGPMTRKAIQGWLSVEADGVFGPVTRKALQAKLGVKQDGKWGRVTISALQRMLNEA